MTSLRVFALRVLALCGRRRRDAALTEEIQTHLDLLAEEFRRGGMSDKDAVVAARREFGGVEQTKELYRDQRCVPVIDALGQDVRYAFRQVRNSPVFALAVIVTLALGTGANTAIFGVLKAAVQGSSFPEADRLVMIWTTPSAQSDVNESASVPEYLAWKEQSRSFDRMGSWISWAGTLGSTINGVPADQLAGQRFTRSLFEVLGARPQLGRLFTEEEDVIGAPADVALISDRLWRNRFAADPSVINSTVLLDGTTTQIIGVMPPGFSFFDDECDYWIPEAFSPFQLKGSARVFTVVARLKSGVSREQAQAEMDAIAAELAKRDPDRNKGRGIRIQFVNDAYFGDVRQLLVVLQGAVGIILLIASANVAGLLLLRGSFRQREVAIRYALGAGRGRILRQFVTESVLLSAVGGIVGVVVAWAGLRLLVTNSPAWLSRVHDVGIDARVLAFTTLVTVLAGLGCGIVPALQVSKSEPIGSLKDTARSTTGSRGRRRIQSALVIAQVALTLVLLVGADLVIKSFMRLQRANIGFDPKGLLSFQSRLPLNKYYKRIGTINGFTHYDVSPDPPLIFDRVVQRLLEFPSVQSAAGVNRVPVTEPPMEVPFAIEGRLPGEFGGAIGKDQLTTNYYMVTPNFFQTMRVPVMRGRDFTTGDRANTPWVAIINEAMARRFWPNDDPLHKRLTVTVVPDEQPREIVGVVADTPLSKWERARAPILYVPQFQQPLHYRAPYGTDRMTMTFLLRTSERPETMIPALRRAVADVDSNVPVANLQPVAQHLAREVDAPRYYMVLLGIFGAVAMILAVGGIYGLVAYSVAERACEIAIRVALGADAARVIRLTAGHGFVLTAVGLIVGLVVAVVLTRFLTAVLWDVTATDPLTFFGVALGLGAVALLACLVPTRRALRMNPRAVLCDE